MKKSNDLFWKNKKVLVTGHTGFKGGWLSLWLHSKGAKVIGYSLAPKTKNNLFKSLKLDNKITSVIGDIRDIKSIKNIFEKHKPEIVFHLAAQPLVRESYKSPVETYETNVIGTANVLESIRFSKSVKVGIFITTDKCYQNNEWVWPYREDDRLGGHDPYSNSKACAELVISSYRNSFFNDKTSKVLIASTRAGNVIGGGDWSEDRLIPDIVKHVFENQNLEIRNPESIRPWQHVLDPVFGYIILAEKLWKNGKSLTEGFNFGPENEEVVSVKKILELFNLNVSKKIEIKKPKQKQPHEANLLLLDSSKAKRKLGWKGKLKVKDAVDFTADWYNAFYSGQNIEQFTLNQIAKYEEI